MSSNYDAIASIYDSINADIDYTSWADFIEECFNRYMPEKPSLVLDLACGTGRMTFELHRRGYDMIGADASESMLGEAYERAYDNGISNILFIKQDMRDFELYGTVDAAVCCLDGINHLTGAKDLDKCLKLVHNYLMPDGLFVFDINGKHKFETVYADMTYTMEKDGAFCIWQNYYNEKSKLCDFYITLFEECEDGRYERYEETQRERMYTVRLVKAALERNSLELVGVYSDFDMKEGSDSDDRLYIVARCIKEDIEKWQSH